MKNNSILSLLISTALLSTCISSASFANTASQSSNSTQFISYWFSWAQGNSAYQYPNLSDVPKGVNQVFVAFALENENNSGINLQLEDENQFAQDVATMHKQGTQVILSSGGATAGYPWDDAQLTDQQVAQQYITFIKQYNLDGIDFDVEAGTGSRLPDIVKIIKQQLSNLQISLTIPSSGSAGFTPAMQTLGQALYQENALNYVNLMNYDQYWTPPVSQCSYTDTTNNMANNCYIQNMQATEAILQDWTNNATTAKQMLSNGIMIGYADDQKIVTPQLASAIATWAQQNGYGAVMTWGLNRDQNATTAGQNLSMTTGMTGLNPQQYTTTIIQGLTSSNK